MEVSEAERNKEQKMSKTISKSQCVWVRFKIKHTVLTKVNGETVMVKQTEEVKVCVYVCGWEVVARTQAEDAFIIFLSCVFHAVNLSPLISPTLPPTLHHIFMETDRAVLDMDACPVTCRLGL